MKSKQFINPALFSSRFVSARVYSRIKNVLYCVLSTWTLVETNVALTLLHVVVTGILVSINTIITFSMVW